MVTQETAVFLSVILGAILVVGVVRIIAIESILKEILKALKNTGGKTGRREHDEKITEILNLK